jgi:hypothetical protein
MLLIGAFIFEPISIVQHLVDHFCGLGGLPQNHQRDEIVFIFTLPFYISAAYSAAAFLAQRILLHDTVKAMSAAG